MKKKKELEDKQEKNEKKKITWNKIRELKQN